MNKRSDKIKALEQALCGNLKPLLDADEPNIVGVIVANKGVFEIVELNPIIKATKSTKLEDLKESIPLFYDEPSR